MKKNSKDKLDKYVILKKDNRKIKIKNGIDLWTLLFWFLLIPFVPSLIRKDFFIAFTLCLAQIFPIMLLYPAMQIEWIMWLCRAIFILSFVYTLYRVKVNNKNRIKRFKANGYVQCYK